MNGKTFDPAATARAQKHFLAAADAFLDAEAAQDPNTDTLPPIISGLAITLVCAVLWHSPWDDNDRSGHEENIEPFNGCLREFDFVARRLFARQPIPDVIPREQNKLTSLRKSLGRLYGIVKAMEASHER
jgi:hypothetical protein